jgi:hypothetical protein
MFERKLQVIDDSVVLNEYNILIQNFFTSIIPNDISKTIKTIENANYINYNKQKIKSYRKEDILKILQNKLNTLNQSIEQEEVKSTNSNRNHEGILIELNNDFSKQQHENKQKIKLELFLKDLSSSFVDFSSIYKNEISKLDIEKANESSHDTGSLSFSNQIESSFDSIFKQQYSVSSNFKKVLNLK